MTDVSHELGALRFVVDSSLSSKVAMFNNQATQHKQSQLLNPFSEVGGRASSPKPTFSKDQYGKPLAGSLTEMRGQKANIHVMKEMVELCQIINSEGYDVKDEPTMRVIPFGELFNIYNYISDKVVGILLRARKHKLVEFEGEMLFQRRDDDVPIFLLKPIREIRAELEAKMEEIKRATSPAPQSTSVLLDKSAHEKKLKSRTPSPAVKSKSPSPQPTTKSAEAAKPPMPPAPVAVPVPVAVAAAAAPTVEPTKVVATETASVENAPPVAPVAVVVDEVKEEVAETPAKVEEEVSQPKEVAVPEIIPESVPEVAPSSTAASASAPAPELPTIVIEASAVFVRKASVDVPATESTEATPAPAPAADDATSS